MNPHLDQTPDDAFWLGSAESFFAGWNVHLFNSWKYRNPEIDLETLHVSDKAQLQCFIESRLQRDGSRKWIVTNKGGNFVLCWTEEGLAFCLESQPSSRDEKWYKDTRFETKEMALAAFKEFCEQSWNQYVSWKG